MKRDTWEGKKIAVVEAGKEERKEENENRMVLKS